MAGSSAFPVSTSFRESQKARTTEPYITGIESVNPMQSVDLPSKRGPPTDGDFPFTNGHAHDGEVRSLRGPRSDMSLAASQRWDSRVSREQLLGPQRPRPHKIWKKKYIKVLVVGDSGLGKTTLVKTLLSTPGERLQVHDGTYTPTEQFVKDPESLCSTVTWKDEEDRVIWVYRVQDTPGYGDDLDVMNHVNLIINFINSQNEKWLKLENARDRQQDMTEVEDPRVDVCLFALPPHRLRCVDLRYMAELGKHVPIIPVVMKADTMTIREAQNYKQEVFNRLQNPQVAGVRAKINTFTFDKESLERAGMLDVTGTTAPPFLVIASNDINDEMNALDVPVFWPERRYPWGTAEAFNPDHSDLLCLRALLLKEALEDICKDKRQRYEAWRKAALSGPRLGAKLRSFALWTVLPVAATLYMAQNGFDFNKVGGKVSKLGSRLPLRISFKGGDAAASSSSKGAVVVAHPVDPEPEPEPEPLPPPPPVKAAPPPKRSWF